MNFYNTRTFLWYITGFRSQPFFPGYVITFTLRVREWGKFFVAQFFLSVKLGQCLTWEQRLQLIVLYLVSKYFLFPGLKISHINYSDWKKPDYKVYDWRLYGKISRKYDVYYLLVLQRSYLKILTSIYFFHLDFSF